MRRPVGALVLGGLAPSVSVIPTPGYVEIDQSAAAPAHSKERPVLYRPVLIL
jgi:hypothetical protein